MTKQQFISGTPFYIGRKAYKGACTYSYIKSIGCILKQNRSSIDERVIIEDYECNIGKIGRLGFTGFTHVMKKKVVVKYKFADLVPFEDQNNN